MHLRTLLASAPAPLAADPASLAQRVRDSGRVLVVLDDDPTGTQPVADLPVLARWEPADFAWALDTGAPAVYVLTNSRSLSPEDAAAINREVVRAALEAGRRRDTPLTFVSRGDSTLRGHFPLEPATIADTIAAEGLPRPDATILVPAFPDAGRVTIDGLHGMLAGEEFTPVGDTEFATDSTFGYRSSDLADWVEEKTGGDVRAADVVRIALADLRRGAERVAEVLRGAAPGAVVVVDAVVEDDLRQLALGLELVEAEGRTHLFRVGPTFVRARIGQAPQPPVALDGPPAEQAARGGLVVVGSHVGLTSRQLAHLVAHRPAARVVELDVPTLLEDQTAAAALDTAVRDIAAAIVDGDVILHSSRTLIRTDDPEESLAISRRVSAAIVDAVRRTVATVRPRFVIAKGGITSSDVATKGLEITRAMVRGSLFPGIVSLWEPAEGPARGVPYIVFAGNVGADDTLTAAVERLSGSPA